MNFIFILFIFQVRSHLADTLDMARYPYIIPPPPSDVAAAAKPARSVRRHQMLSESLSGGASAAEEKEASNDLDNKQVRYKIPRKHVL